jgi:succinate dehydrogenase / fumarate reductase iron-sulfur subunit
VTYDLTLRLWRGDSGGGDIVDYVVGVDEGEVVLDAVHHVQAQQAGDLAVRWNCKAGKCGSCSAEVNGRPRLMCLARLSTFPRDEPITVTPLRAFPITPTAEQPQAPFRMQQVDVERSQEFRKCIECWLCQDTCHVVRDHEENKEAFSGPRFFLRYAELEMHPNDALDRRRLAQEERGLGLCNITKCCTEVCPEQIKITDNAIIPLKERVADVKYDPIRWLGSKIGRRPEAPAAAGGQDATGG